MRCERCHLAPLAGILLLAGVVSAQAEGGVVKGTVEAPGLGFAGRLELEETVIQLHPRPGEVEPPNRPLAEALVEVVHDDFRPRVLAIRTGTTVEFLNRDSHIHNVLSSSPAPGFDLGMSAPGESRRFTFADEGVVRVGCKAEPLMEAFIVVGSGYFATVADDGSYRIDDVPVGSYDAEAWNPGHDPVRSTVTIQREADVVRKDFRFVAPR